MGGSSAGGGGAHPERPSLSGLQVRKKHVREIRQVADLAKSESITT